AVFLLFSTGKFVCTGEEFKNLEKMKAWKNSKEK
ncbi:unnamed protein product, partial [marine sediment metagenome]